MPAEFVALKPIAGEQWRSLHHPARKKKKKTWIPINLWTTRKHVYIKAPSKQKLVAYKNPAASPKLRLLGYAPAIQLQTSNENALIRLRLHGTRKGGGAPDTALNAWNMETTHGMCKWTCIICVCVCAMVCAHIPVEDIQVWCINIIYYILYIFCASLFQAYSLLHSACCCVSQRLHHHLKDRNQQYDIPLYWVVHRDPYHGL